MIQESYATIQELKFTGDLINVTGFSSALTLASHCIRLKKCKNLVLQDVFHDYGEYDPEEVSSDVREVRD